MRKARKVSRIKLDNISLPTTTTNTLKAYGIEYEDQLSHISDTIMKSLSDEQVNHISLYLTGRATRELTKADVQDNRIRVSHLSISSEAKAILKGLGCYYYDEIFKLPKYELYNCDDNVRREIECFIEHERAKKELEKIRAKVKSTGKRLNDWTNKNSDITPPVEGYMFGGASKYEAPEDLPPDGQVIVKRRFYSDEELTKGNKNGYGKKIRSKRSSSGKSAKEKEAEKSLAQARKLLAAQGIKVSF